jgi:septum formation protein
VNIILGSSSSGRAKVLKKMGYAFEVFPANIDEKAIRHENPEKLVKKIAHAKATQILERFKELESLERHRKERALLITSDQVVLFNGIVREKPRDLEEARFFVTNYSEKSAESITAVVITDIFSGARVWNVDKVVIQFDRLPKVIVNHYVQGSNSLQCAGGIEIENKILKLYIDKIEDDQINSVIGLPSKLTQSLLDVF